MNKVCAASQAFSETNSVALQRNLRAVLLLRAAQRFMLIAPILVPFFAYYGQDIQQIFWLESLYALTVLIMEVPSGYLADRYGRVAVLRAGGVVVCTMACVHDWLLDAWSTRNAVPAAGMELDDACGRH